MTLRKVLPLFRIFAPKPALTAISIEVDGIPIEVTRKKIRNIHLRVCPPDGRVRVSAPLRMSLSVIREFAGSRTDWIRKHRQRMRERPQAKPLDYADGEMHYLWGRPYRLQVRETDAPAGAAVSGDSLVLNVPAGAGRRKRQAVLEAWYRDRLLEVLPELFGKWEPLTGVKAGRLSLRRMKTQWGSCSPRTGNIRLNTELAKKPMDCLEYVLVHELTHVLEASHNHRFKSLMDRFMPDWRARRAVLRSGAPLREG